MFFINMITSLIHGFRSPSLGFVMWDLTATRRLAIQVEDGLFDRDKFRPVVEFSSNWFEMGSYNFYDPEHWTIVLLPTTESRSDQVDTFY